MRPVRCVPEIYMEQLKILILNLKKFNNPRLMTCARVCGEQFSPILSQSAKDINIAS